jgi:hypothetical protein
MRTPLPRSWRGAASANWSRLSRASRGNLRSWQTSKTRVEALTAGPPRAGYRVREWTKVPGRKEFEQVVEFTQFERPSHLHTHIVEDPSRSMAPGC